ncbi:P-loop containing nucleoside triphosphate hydrolase protein [Mycena sanguinolenta]|nr:P-loop containing nucleoside triphosphate hydrolase protein [Mycena sanguinolenta]
MDSLQLSALPDLTPTQKAAFRKGSVQTVAELLLVSPQDLGRRCKISPLEVKAIFNTVCQNNSPQIKSLADVGDDQEQVCTTGDNYLDAALGGGLRPGMVWEVFGQSAAGKTQMALQLSLFVQVPVSLGGLSGSACYITIASSLPTSRLLQMMEAHPQLSSELCGLENINTIKCPNIPILIHILSKILPDLIVAKANNPASKPVRLVVIDALAELFRSDDKTTTSTLVDRSHNIVEISTLLHSLASTYNLCILVLNEVSDVFGRGDEEMPGGDLSYKQQSRWFGGADSVPGEGNKEASLGLVWANQVNARIMFSRTGRRRYLQDSVDSKRQKADGSHSAISPNLNNDEEDGATLIRRMSVIFSSVGPPCSLDYIVTAAGICVLPEDDVLSPPESSFLSPTQEDVPQDANHLSGTMVSQVAPLDVGLLEHDAQSEALNTTGEDEDLEWEKYWNTDAISEDMYNSLE